MNDSKNPLRHLDFRHVRNSRENMLVFEQRQFIKLKEG